ncbi:MAG: translocation/assembly module TamB, partial [Holosporales bacterium]|nr:translocation/assembly module TamB [Holosporales bacterium]
QAFAKGFLEIPATTASALEQRVLCDLQLDFRHLLIIGQDDLKATASGPVCLSGTLPALSLTGTLTLSHIDFLITKSPTEETGNLRIIEIGPHKKRPSFARTHLYLPFLCAVVLPSPSVYVHGQSVESQWGGTLKLVGGLSDPVALEGELCLQHGYLDFCGRRLPLVRGKITYTAQTPLEPAVQLRGHKIFSDLDVFLSVVTTPSEIYFQLTSMPDHSTEDILAILLFGKLSSELSPLEMVQLLHAASSFQGNVESPLQLLDTMRYFSGVDTITYSAQEKIDAPVGTTTSSTRTFTLGKYINNKIFLGVDNELDSNTTIFRVQMLLTPRTMLEAKTNGEFGISWRQPF